MKLVVISLLRSLLILSRFKYVALAGFGLGLGVSLSLIVYQNPLGTVANSSSSHQNEVRSLRIKPNSIVINSGKSTSLEVLNDLAPKSWYWSDRAQYWSEGATIGQAGPLTFLVGLRSGLRPELSDLSLGDSLVVVGENGGEYRYGVVELRELATSQLSDALEQAQPTLVLIVAQSWTGEKVWVAIAR